MGSEFWSAAGQIFGVTMSGVLVFGAFRVGGTYKGIIRDVGDTKDSCAKINTTLDSLTPRVQTIEQTLHGPQGGNGMYLAVRNLEAAMTEIREQRIGPPDRRKSPRVVKNDRRRKSA